MTQNIVKTTEVTRWVNEYADDLYQYTFQRVRDKPTAMDIVQEVFLSAWKNFESYRKDAAIKTWLLSILKNKIIDYYRSTVHSSTGDSGWSYFDSQEHWTEESAPVEWNAGQVHKMEQDEFFRILAQCKDKLQQLQKMVFAMKHIDDMKSDEICRLLNITASNYWVIMHRAKVQLRACLEVNWFTR